MRITESQLRRIIRQEVRALHESLPTPGGMSPQYGAPIQAPTPASGPVGNEAMLVIPRIGRFGGARFVKRVEKLIKQYQVNYPSVKFEAPGGMPAYNPGEKSLTIVGSEPDLKNFAWDLDDDMMGGAQSIADEDSFANGIRPV